MYFRPQGRFYLHANTRKAARCNLGSATVEEARPQAAAGRVLCGNSYCKGAPTRTSRVPEILAHVPDNC